MSWVSVDSDYFVTSTTDRNILSSIIYFHIKNMMFEKISKFCYSVRLLFFIYTFMIFSYIFIVTSVNPRKYDTN